MNDKQAAEFERTKECNFAISPPGIGRFRVNAFMQQGKVGMVLRVIPQTCRPSTAWACRRCSRTWP
jgi:twitching motility protein PilU